MIYTVSKLSSEIKKYIESLNEYRYIEIEGEISNFVSSKGEHLYFNLKEKDDIIKCTSFFYKGKIDVSDIKNGDKVLVKGSLAYYKSGSVVQINAKSIKKYDDKGDLYKQLEKTKIKYLSLGYFDEKIKKQLPKYPNKIGVVTSISGAAVQDIIRTTHDRNENVDIYVYSAKVQGEGSSLSVARGIEYFNNKMPDLDCIIVGRGGGSIEDLWAFNEEPVIEAIYNSKICIISAVGHETDILLSDLVADVRASTPTKAAEMLIPKKEDIVDNLKQISKFFDIKLLNKIKHMEMEINNIRNSYYIKNFSSYSINERCNLLLELNEKIKRAVLDICDFNNKYQKLEYINNQLTFKIQNKISILENEIKQLDLKLEKYNINDTLSRGFTVTTFSGKLLKNIKIKKGDVLETKYLNGTILSEVK